jgi:hypothetical protein
MVNEPPPQYPGYPNYPYPPPYAPRPYNTYAILSLVFALAVFPPLGIYFGHKAKQQIAQTGERGIELANVGYILGWVFTALMGVFLLLWCGFTGLLISGSIR